MSQYIIGTCSVTNGSAVVTFVGTSLLTEVTNLHTFQLQSGNGGYNLPIASVDSDTQITLVSAFTGTTASGLAYYIHRDFTLQGLPRMFDGDVSTPQIFTRAIDKIDDYLTGLSPTSVSSLSDLSDVDNALAPTNNQVLKYSTALGYFVAAADSTGTFAGLSDTNIVSPADYELPVFVAATNKWVNLSAASALLSEVGHTHTIDELSDATITALGNDELLVSSSGVFINKTFAEAGLSETSHNHTVDTLSNVVITSIADNDIIGWDTATSKWINQSPTELGVSEIGHSHYLQNLTDVTLTTPADGEILTYDTGTSMWINAAPASLVNTLDDLTDVVLTGPLEDREVIMFDFATSKWINQTTAESGFSLTTHQHAFTDMSDANPAMTPGNYDILQWDNGNSRWQSYSDLKVPGSAMISTDGTFTSNTTFAVHQAGGSAYSAMRFTNFESGLSSGNGLFIGLSSGLSGEFWNVENAASYLATNNQECLVLNTDQSVGFYGPALLKQYTTGSLPTASSYKGGLAFDSTQNELKFSDGATWLSAFDISTRSIKNLLDVYSSMTPVDGQVLTYDLANARWTAAAPTSGGATTFLGLTDTPSAYTSKGGYLVRVNGGATALEFISNAGFYNPYVVINGSSTLPTAAGTQSITIGATSTAAGNYVVSIGYGTSSSADNGVAIGRSASVTGTEGVAIGYNSSSSSEGVAIGYNASANATSGIAIGYNATSGTGIQMKLATTVHFDMTSTGVVSSSGSAAQYKLTSYTVATLPTGSTGGMIFVTDEVGGSIPAFYDGTNWRRVTDRAIVS